MKFFSDAACDPNIPLKEAIRLFNAGRARQMKLRTAGLFLGLLALGGLGWVPPGAFEVYVALLAIAWFPFLLSVYLYGADSGDGHEVSSWVRTLEERHRRE